MCPLNLQDFPNHLRYPHQPPGLLIRVPMKRDQYNHCLVIGLIMTWPWLNGLRIFLVSIQRWKIVCSSIKLSTYKWWNLHIWECKPLVIKIYFHIQVSIKPVTIWWWFDGNSTNRLPMLWLPIHAGFPKARSLMTPEDIPWKSPWRIYIIIYI